MAVGCTEKHHYRMCACVCVFETKEFDLFSFPHSMRNQLAADGVAKNVPFFIE